MTSEGKDNAKELKALRSMITKLERQIEKQERVIAQQAETISALQPKPFSEGNRKSASKRSAHITPDTDADFTIVFDGGSKGNPGLGYGSYRIVDADGAEIAGERLEFGDGMTNNNAEFRTLNAALSHLALILGDGAKKASVSIFGDSKLVIYGSTGAWKIKHPDLIPLRKETVTLLSQFSSTKLQWHGRSNSVKVLGH
ncbi:MAG: reverse transcriptase-like protein [Chloroflexota bacterium]